MSELKPGDAANLADIIKASKYPGIIYEFKPNLKSNFVTVLVETNNEGWRGKSYSIRKSKNVIRIICLGDSHMFGWGVPNDKKYTNVLEDMLNSRFPQKKWEVINTAVPGYNTYMEIETLERKGLIYEPDIVLMEYIGNDLDLPNFIMENTDYLNFKKSFILNFLRGRAKLLETKIGLKATPTFLEYDHIRFEGENDINKVPLKYRFMVGWNSYVKSMLKLKKMQKRDGFDVFICVSHTSPGSTGEKIERLCNELGFYVLISLQRFDPPFVLSSKDTHPSEAGHELIADNLLEFMIREKMIEKHIKK